VLTTEYVAGRRFAEVMAEDQAARERWGEILYRFVFGSIFRFGVFNGDPHPGNYLFDADGRMTFLDFGCVKNFSISMRRGWQALLVAHLQGDRQRFRDLLVQLGFIKPGVDVETELLYRYLGAFYEPFKNDAPFTYTRERSRVTFQMVFKPPAEFKPLAQVANMPRDYVFVNRIQWGVESILAQLGATANWHRILDEYFHGAPPSTELGRIDAVYRGASERQEAKAAG
jgi:predicted unusual protein kinase regulating ubiquinone biosynthesis (AarF/ABC1/UbiB family)